MIIGLSVRTILKMGPRFNAQLVLRRPALRKEDRSLLGRL